MNQIVVMAVTKKIRFVMLIKGKDARFLSILTPSVVFFIMLDCMPHKLNILLYFLRCDFERDMCGWEISAGSELSWDRYRTNGLPFAQRPPYDHTTRSQQVCFLVEV